MILNILQIITAIILIVFILLQQRGSGLGSAFGGESAVFRTKRGIEKSLHIATIIVTGIFLIVAFLNILY
jgi:preprotein translocase subunit SecG